MSTILFRTLRTITTATASSEATSYDATNVAERSIARMWRSTGTSSENITLTIASAAVKGVFITHCNFDSATIEYDNSGWVSLGTLSMRNDIRILRRFGAMDIGDTGVTTTQFRITPGGSPTGSEGYWYIGAVYLFGVRNPLERSPNIDETSAASRNIEARRLPNGRTARVLVGDYASRSYRMSWTFQQSSLVGGGHPISRLIGSSVAANDVIGLIWPHYYLPDSSDPDTGVFYLADEEVEESDRNYGVRETSVTLEEVF